jgi:hypothetical protein
MTSQAANLLLHTNEPALADHSNLLEVSGKHILVLSVLLLELAGDALVGEAEEGDEVVLEVLAVLGVGEGLGRVRLGLADVVAGDGFGLGLLAEDGLELGEVLVVGGLEVLGGKLGLLLDEDGDGDGHFGGG